MENTERSFTELTPETLIELRKQRNAERTAKVKEGKERRAAAKKAAEEKAAEEKMLYEAARTSVAPKPTQEKRTTSASHAPAAPEGKRYKYDRYFPVEWTDLQIEMLFYVNRKSARGLRVEDHFINAFKILWPHFQWNDWFDMLIRAWCRYRVVVVIGHARASKTFGMAHIALLDWICSPTDTATTFTTTKFDALKQRLWGDTMIAWETSTIYAQGATSFFKATSTSNELKFENRLEGIKSDDKFLIQGIATDRSDAAAGKIRGQHAQRRRIVVDECQDVADAIYTALGNAISAPDFRCALLTNPVDKITEFGKWCEPKNGWSSIRDTDLYWELKIVDGICLHFDGLQSPNIKAGKTIWNFLLTQDFIDTIRSTYGENSKEWWMYVRGFFPPDGMVSKVWPSSTIEAAKLDVDFDFPPVPAATLDPAFESDDCVFHLWEIGRTRDGLPCARGRKTIVISTKQGPLEKPADHQVAERCIELCKANGVKPEDFIMDETGNARGTLAIMRVEWDPKVQGVNYAGSSTERPLRINDPKPAVEQVKLFVSELWFRASFMAQSGMIRGLGNLHSKTIDDLSARRYSVVQKLMVVESKGEMKGRLSRSPDYGDSACQIGELMARKGMFGEVIGTSKPPGRSGRARARRAAARFNHEKEFSYAEN